MYNYFGKEHTNNSLERKKCRKRNIFRLGFHKIVEVNGMLRGVNKSIIEVLETENQYFEKAILFIRPGHRDQDTGFMKTKAKEYLSNISYKPASKWKKPFLYSAVKLGSAAALGAAAATFLLKM